MTLRERLKDDTTAAMRSGDALRRDVLRMVQNAVYNIDKAKHTTMSDDEIVGVISREVKTRRESVEAFRAGGREDLVDQGRGRDRDPPRLPPRGHCPTTSCRRSSTRASRRPGPPRPATWARSWAGSPRRSAAGRTARSRPASSRRRWHVLTWPRTIRGTDPPPRRSTPCSPHPPSPRPQFTRRDAGRLFAASVVLIAAMSVILGLDFLPAQPRLEAGRPAPTLVQAPRTDRVRQRHPHPAAARRRERGDHAAVRLHLGRCRRGRRPSSCASSTRRSPRSRPRSPTGVKPADRDLILQTTLPGLSSDDRTTLTGLDKERWTAIRAEAARVLETIERAELRDSEVAPIQRSRRGPHGGRPQRRRARARRGPHRARSSPPTRRSPPTSPPRRRPRPPRTSRRS